MRMNPVYKREVMVSARSFRLALMLLVFNGILALVALLNMYSTLAQVRLTAEIQYTSFLDLYLFVAALEFVMLIFFMPAITAGSISGERERQTLDLMLTTKMKPAEIVLGKMAASLSTMALMIISSFPIIAMVFVYGGVTLRDIALMLLCYMAAALFAGSIGICCSAFFGKTTMSTVVAYGILGLVVLGTFGVNQFAYYMSGVHTDGNLASIGQIASYATSGNCLYLLLLNPTVNFLMTITRLTGREQAIASVTTWFGHHEQTLIASQWVLISILLQLALAAVFLWAAIQAVSMSKNTGKKRR
ncbi:MAG: ABC transporter permease [Lachnospiraceae bacterium]|nr:ABC transporter permease [Lachnospiraceae bacterium]